jgi:hypothetical protein
LKKVFFFSNEPSVIISGFFLVSFFNYEYLSQLFMMLPNSVACSSGYTFESYFCGLEFFGVNIGSFGVIISFLFVFMLLSYLGLKLANKTIFLKSLIVILSVVNLLQLGFYINKNANKGEPVSQKFDKTSKNVYLIVPDMFVGPEVMKLQYKSKYDFTKNLKEKGFKIIKNPRSNAPATGYSMPHFFKMKYYLKDGQVISDEEYEKIWLFPSAFEVRKEFHKRGYNYYMADDGSYIRCLGYEDKCFPKKAFPNRYDFNFLLQSMFFKLYEIQNRKLGSFGFKKLIELKDMIEYLPKPEKRPFFLYVHVSMPHPPIRLDENCKPLKNRTYTSADSYEKQAICASKMIDKTVDKILSRDPNAIIIVQSDHGARFANKANNWLEAYNASFNNLTAFKLPKKCEKYLYDNMSPVNSFRLVFACLDEKKLTF